MRKSAELDLIVWAPGQLAIALLTDLPWPDHFKTIMIHYFAPTGTRLSILLIDSLALLGNVSRTAASLHLLISGYGTRLALREW
jgi:hypothetical protein